MQLPEWVRARREVAFAIVGTVVTAATQLAMLRRVSFCGTPDSCTYLALGESLSQHRGFTENFLYQYQFVSHVLPTHGIDYWRPGTSFLLLLAQPFGGVTLHSSLVVSLLAGIFLSLAAWRIAMNYSHDRRIACASYLLCLMLSPVWVGALSADSTLFYGAFTAWFLALLRVRCKSYLEDFFALACVAVVSLIRNDAILLLVPLLAVLWMRWRHREQRGSSAGYLALLLVGFALANLPMHAIDYAVLGNASPSSTTGALYLRDLADLEIYNEPVTLHRLLLSGAGALIRSRLTVLPTIVYRLVFVLFGFAAIFIPLLGLRHSDGRKAPMPEWIGGLSFFVAVVGVYAFVLPAVGAFSALRSFTGLLPLGATLAVAGLFWLEVSLPTRMRMFAMVLAFYFIANVMTDRRAIEQTNTVGATDRKIAAFLAARGKEPGPSTLVMSANPAQFSVTTGYASVPMPSDGLDAVRHAALDLHVTTVLVDQESFDGWSPNLEQALNAVAVERVPDTNVMVLTLPNPTH